MRPRYGRPQPALARIMSTRTRPAKQGSEKIQPAGARARKPARGGLPAQVS